MGLMAGYGLQLWPILQGKPTIVARKLRHQADREFQGMYAPRDL